MLCIPGGYLRNPLLLFLLCLLFTACGAQPERSPDKSVDLAARMEEESAIVQRAIHDYMKRTGALEIPARDKARQIGPLDVNVPFKGDLSIVLPTKFKYSWDEQGKITGVSHE